MSLLIWNENLHQVQSWLVGRIMCVLVSKIFKATWSFVIGFRTSDGRERSDIPTPTLSGVWSEATLQHQNQWSWTSSVNYGVKVKTKNHQKLQPVTQSEEFLSKEIHSMLIQSSGTYQHTFGKPNVVYRPQSTFSFSAGVSEGTSVLPYCQSVTPKKSLRNALIFGPFQVLPVETTIAWCQGMLNFTDQHINPFDVLVTPPSIFLDELLLNISIILSTSPTSIWRFPKIGVPPKHPKAIIFSRKTHGCWVPSF